MSASLTEELPHALQGVQTRSLFVMRLEVRPLQLVGATPAGTRRVAVVPGGEFTGERLSGVVLDGASDWQSVRTDAVTTLDVRMVLKTHDGALIAMAYRGLRHGPAELMRQIDQGAEVDPSSYYFRISAQFETSAPQYEWINRILAIGVGDRRRTGPIYSLFEVL